MSQSINNLDEINKQLQLTTLQHAAEISVYIKGRTIGPDLPEWSDEWDNVPEEQCKVEKSPETSHSPQKIDISPSSVANMDYEALKASALLRDAGLKQKTAMRELLKKLVRNRPVQQQSEKNNKWLLDKKEAENEIIRQAQQNTERELEENRRNLAALQQQTQAMVAQLQCNIQMQKKAAEAKRAQELLQQEQQQQQLQLQQQQQKADEAAAIAAAEKKAAEKAAAEKAAAEKAAVEQAAAAVAVPPATVPETSVPADPNAPAQQHFVYDIATPERLSLLATVNAVYHKKLEAAQNLQADESAKTLKNTYKKAINVPINAISAVSGQNLNDKFMRILGFFNGQPAGNSDITINSHPLARDYCLVYMAKKIISQADSAISCNPQAAYPIASVVMALWQHIPEFGAVFLAHVYEEAPFLLPHFITPKQGQDSIAYLNNIGYRLIDGALESHDDFLKRQTGIARLYAAIMVTSGRKADAAKQPYGIQEAWRWLANFVRLDPLPDISATILLEILQIVSADMWTHYGRQFVKLLFYVHAHYMPKLGLINEGGPKTRLQLLLSKFLNEGQVVRPAGMLPPDFW